MASTQKIIGIGQRWAATALIIGLPAVGITSQANAQARTSATLSHSTIVTGNTATNSTIGGITGVGRAFNSPMPGMMTRSTPMNGSIIHTLAPPTSTPAPQAGMNQVLPYYAPGSQTPHHLQLFRGDDNITYANVKGQQTGISKILPDCSVTWGKPGEKEGWFGYSQKQKQFLGPFESNTKAYQAATLRSQGLSIDEIKSKISVAPTTIQVTAQTIGGTAQTETSAHIAAARAAGETTSIGFINYFAQQGWVHPADFISTPQIPVIAPPPQKTFCEAWQQLLDSPPIHFEEGGKDYRVNFSKYNPQHPHDKHAPGSLHITWGDGASNFGNVICQPNGDVSVYGYGKQFGGLEVTYSVKDNKLVYAKGGNDPSENELQLGRFLIQIMNAGTAAANAIASNAPAPQAAQSAPPAVALASPPPAPTETVPARAPVAKQNLAAPRAHAPAAIASDAISAQLDQVIQAAAAKTGADVQIGTKKMGIFTIKHPNTDIVQVNGGGFETTFNKDGGVTVTAMKDGNSVFSIKGVLRNKELLFQHTDTAGIPSSDQTAAANAASTAFSAVGSDIGKPQHGPHFQLVDEIPNKPQSIASIAGSQQFASVLPDRIQPIASVGNQSFTSSSPAFTATPTLVSNPVAGSGFELRNNPAFTSFNGQIPLSALGFTLVSGLGLGASGRKGSQKTRERIAKVKNLFRTAAEMAAKARIEFRKDRHTLGQFLRGEAAQFADFVRNDVAGFRAPVADTAPTINPVEAVSSPAPAPLPNIAPPPPMIAPAPMVRAAITPVVVNQETVREASAQLAGEPVAVPDAPKNGFWKTMFQAAAQIVTAVVKKVQAFVANFVSNVRDALGLPQPARGSNSHPTADAPGLQPMPA